jgi:hypothetical protein
VRRLRPALLVGAVVVALSAAVSATASASASTRTPKPHAPATSRPTGRATPGPVTAGQLLAGVRDCAPVSDGRYAMAEGGRAHVPVCRTGSAYFWTSDMAIDCDGEVTDQCNGDTDSTFSEGTNFLTSTGDYFTADTTHYFVIPLPSDRFDYRNAGIKPGNVGAVIYDNKLVYAVFADLGPRNIIGEASYATADDLGVETDPSIGGTAGPVTFIVFPGVVPDPVEDNSVIDRVGEAAARSFLGMHGSDPKPTHAPTHPPAPTHPATPSRAHTHAPTPAPTHTRASHPSPSPTRAHASHPGPTPRPTRSPSPSPSPTRSPAPAVLGVGPMTGLDDGCVDVEDAKSVNGTKIQLYGCNSGPQQTWTVRRDGTLRSVGKCLGVHDAATTDGAKVEIHSCDGSAAQRWNRRGDQLVNAKSGKCLDVTARSSDPGTPLQIWTCTDAANQKWHLPSTQPSP